MTDIETLTTALGSADTVAALTGAGISAPSGVPTFRGEDGLWEEFDPGQFHFDRFKRDPGGFWRDRQELQDAMAMEDVEPNPAHDALTDLAADGVLDAIATQNVDGLHDAASEAGAEVLELHGNTRRVRCLECDRAQPVDPVVDRVDDGEIPPRCACGGLLKPDVVLFGEQLPSDVLQRAQELAQQSDVYLAVGSSLVVEPAASLPRIAASNGATLGIVNLESTPCDGMADVCLQEDVTTVLPSLASSVV